MLENASFPFWNVDLNNQGLHFHAEKPCPPLFQQPGNLSALERKKSSTSSAVLESMVGPVSEGHVQGFR